MIERMAKDLTYNSKNYRKSFPEIKMKKKKSYILQVPSPLQLPFFLALQLVQMLKAWNQHQVQ